MNIYMQITPLKMLLFLQVLLLKKNSFIMIMI